MGNISNYARVLKAKLQDVFVCDQTDSNVTTTKSVTVEQIGDAICGEQVHSDLKTDNQTIIGGINELAKDKNVADEYDDTHTYNTGDVTIYGNTLYICTTNNTTGTFDPSKWTATTIDNIIGDLSSLTTSDKSSLVGAVNEVVTDITSLENDRMITETITVPSISFSTWVPNINYADVNITTTYTIASGASVIVQSAHKQVLVVSSSGANKTIDLRVITFGSSSQTSVQFKVIYKKA